MTTTDTGERASVGYPRKRARTRRQLMVAGMAEMGDRGAQGVTVGGVAKRARVATGTFYNHFDDLGSLRQAIVDDLASAVEFSHEQLTVVENDPARRVALGCLQLLDLARHDEPTARAFVRLVVTVPELRSRVRSTVALAVGAGIDSGRFRPGPLLLAVDAVLGTSLNWMTTIIAGDEEPGTADRDYVAHLLRVAGLGDADIASVIDQLADLRPIGVVSSR